MTLLNFTVKQEKARWQGFQKPVIAWQKKQEIV